MKKNLILLIPIFMIVFIIISYAIIFSNLENIGINRKDIINKFKKNRGSFEEVVIELRDEKEVYYSGGYILIYNGEKSERVYPTDEEKLKKYQKTYNLKEALNLSGIEKKDGNIGFYFDGNARKTAWIVYLTSEDDWINCGYSILYKKQLEGNWYYIESN